MKKVKIHGVEYKVTRIVKNQLCNNSNCDDVIYNGESIIADKNGNAYHFDLDSKEGKRCGVGVEGHETCLEDDWWGDQEVSCGDWYFIQIQGHVIQINDKGKIIDDYDFGWIKMDKEYQWKIAPIDDEGYYIKEEEE